MFQCYSSPTPNSLHRASTSLQNGKSWWNCSLLVIVAFSTWLEWMEPKKSRRQRFTPQHWMHAFFFKQMIQDVPASIPWKGSLIPNKHDYCEVEVFSSIWSKRDNSWATSSSFSFSWLLCVYSLMATTWALPVAKKEDQDTTARRDDEPDPFCGPCTSSNSLTEMGNRRSSTELRNRTIPNIDKNPNPNINIMTGIELRNWNRT